MPVGLCSRKRHHSWRNRYRRPGSNRWPARRTIAPMPTEIDDAWNDLHTATPPGWFVGQPSYDERREVWEQYAFDPAEQASGRCPLARVDRRRGDRAGGHPRAGALPPADPRGAGAGAWRAAIPDVAGRGWGVRLSSSRSVSGCSPSCRSSWPPRCCRRSRRAAARPNRCCRTRCFPGTYCRLRRTR